MGRQPMKMTPYPGQKYDLEIKPQKLPVLKTPLFLFAIAWAIIILVCWRLWCQL